MVLTSAEIQDRFWPKAEADKKEEKPKAEADKKEGEKKDEKKEEKPKAEAETLAALTVGCVSGLGSKV